MWSLGPTQCPLTPCFGDPCWSLKVFNPRVATRWRSGTKRWQVKRHMVLSSDVQLDEKLPRDANVSSKRRPTLWYKYEQSPSEWPTREGQPLSWNKLLEWIWYALLSPKEQHRSQAGGKQVILTSCPANGHLNIYVELHQIRSCCHSAVVSISLFPFWICSIDFTTN